MIKCFYMLTGGRPMERLDYAFTDHVSGESVCHYRDKLGRIWLATGSWALFRVAWTGISYD